MGRPASAVSLFTAVGAGIVLVLVVLALVFQWGSWALAIWIVPLVGVIWFSLWAARGSGPG
jgi:hypothetical protein